ncbi:MAG: hypothetical protein CMB80_07995 [Flammeovirgaceae bacterium]|nr:hypothetical protein [Flammeovirgaceae bacterium]
MNSFYAVLATIAELEWKLTKILITDGTNSILQRMQKTHQVAQDQNVQEMQKGKNNITMEFKAIKEHDELCMCVECLG